MHENVHCLQLHNTLQISHSYRLLYVASSKVRRPNLIAHLNQKIKLPERLLGVNLKMDTPNKKNCVTKKTRLHAQNFSTISRSQ